MDEIGIEWEIPTADGKWNDRYEELKAHKDKHGNTIVGKKENQPLYHWLYKQKRLKNGPYSGSPQLTKNQIDKLTALGINWNTKDSK